MSDHKRVRRASGSKGASPIIQGDSDHRKYRLSFLANGIEALLVKIPEGQSSKAAVSVAVNAGSMHEPDDFGGLAHFVEHCVFLGNDKYPNRNSLDKLLAKHNGYSNAHTELEYTAYYLEVNQEGLAKAVDIFSAAFASPSFDQEMCCAELEAVDSEFHEILNNDDCRIEQMICALSTPDHKYKKFTWGNRASLTKQGPEALVGAAKQFFDSHYSPSRMKLCIVSSYSFEKMERLAKSFESMPCRDTGDIPLSPLEGIPFPIQSSELPLTLFMEPVADIHQLILLFQLPAILSFYHSKPVDYIAHLVGHEGEGSLIASLRAAGLASDITAGVGSDGYSSNSGLSMFEIKLTLTRAGTDNWQRIANEYVFPYIDLVKEQGVDERVYSELREIGRIEFHHSTEDSTKEPIDAAEELAIQLLDHLRIDRKDLLIHDYMYSDSFDAQIISDFLSCINKDRAITVLVSPNSKPVTGEATTEPVFGISYTQSQGLSGSVATSLAEGNFIVPPRPNLYVPKTLQSEAVLAEPCSDSFTSPTIAIQNDRYRLFGFKQVRSQPSHKTDIRLRLNVTAESGGFVETHLRAAYLTDLLESDLYWAKLVGYAVGISAVPPGKGNSYMGIEICVNGFQEHMLSLVKLILEKAAEPPTEADRFARIHELVKRGYMNEEIHPATNQGSNIRKSVLAPISFFRSKDKLELIEALNQIPDPVNCVSIDAVVVGSFSEALIHDIEKLIESSVGGTSTSCPEQGLVVRTIDGELNIVETTLNPKEPTSCLLMYYQVSPEFSIEKSAITDVLSDLMSEPFFDCLRTEEQLGYSVQCGARYTNGSIGLEFLIQSSSETPANMIGKIEAFIATFFDNEIEPMSQDEFDDQVKALTASLLEPPSSLAKETRDLWSEINENRLLWDVNVKTSAEIEKVFLGNKEAIRTAIRENLRKDNRIVVQVNGDGKVSH